MNWNLKEAIEYYRGLGAPRDQNALIHLLREIQRESGGSIPVYLLSEVAAGYQIGEGFLKAIIHRIPSLRLENSHCLEICGGPNCGKHTHLSDFAEQYLKSHPKSFTIKHTPCMRMCAKGPNIKWDGKLYHKADIALLTRLMEEA